MIMFLPRRPLLGRGKGFRCGQRNAVSEWADFNVDGDDARPAPITSPGAKPQGVGKSSLS